MALSAHDRKVLAAIEHDLNDQDPGLADLFATAERGGGWLLPVPLRHLAWLVGALLLLITVHMTVAELNPLGSAALTGVLIIAWLAATTRATRGRWWGPVPALRRRPNRDADTGRSRTAARDDDRGDADNRDDPDDGCLA